MHTNQMEKKQTSHDIEKRIVKIETMLSSYDTRLTNVEENSGKQLDSIKALEMDITNVNNSINYIEKHQTSDKYTLILYSFFIAIILIILLKILNV